MSPTNRNQLLPPLILVVEDNPAILSNLQILLEFNDFKVITAVDGEDALRLLSETEKIPDLILSDIVMPKMNGYDFFRNVSEDPKFFHIPFIFISARSTPDDVRFGKMLGVDDYITKPFKEDDLLAIIKGKLYRTRKIRSINKKMLEIISEIYLKPTSSSKPLTFFIVDWIQNSVPELTCIFPEEAKKSFDFEKLLNCFSESVYEQEGFPKAKALLLKLDRINKDCFVYFDFIRDISENLIKRRYLLCVLASSLSYYDSLRIKEVFAKISNDFKQSLVESNMESYWRDIINLIE